jgi:hypothetical protein
MGEGMRPRNRSPIVVTSAHFRVPNWSSVIELDDELLSWGGSPPPNLLAESTRATMAGNMVAATFTTATDTIHPFAVCGPSNVMYCYAMTPSEGLPPSLGTPERQYILLPDVPPPDLSVQYDISGARDGEESFIIITSVPTVYGRVNRWFLESPSTGGKKHLLELTQPEESPMSGMVRATVAWNVLKATRDPDHLQSLAGILPYELDSPEVADARISHIAQWQFKTSRTRPLYA